MKIVRLILFIAIPLMLSLTSQAQKRGLEKAKKLYESEEYFEAIEKYKKVYSKVKDRKQKAEVAFRMAECYRSMNDAKHALSWYKRAVKGKYADPKAILYYADMLKKLEDYEEAREQYAKYAEILPEAPEGKAGVESCTNALAFLKKPSNIILTPLTDPSSKQMDYSPAVASEDDNTIYFVSAREGVTGKKFNTRSGQKSADIFTSTVDTKGEWSIPMPIEGEVNGDYDEGSFTFNNDFTQMYFTRCEMQKKKDMVCRIYLSTKSGDTWGAGNEIVLVTDSSVTVGQPSLSADELTLYFTSDLEGGKGSRDIWKVTRPNASGNWSQPINLGDSVNTPDYEAFPYIHKNNTLYFASNRRTGMGGLDVYSYGPNADSVLTVQNMGVPVNSAADDFGISFDSSGKKGYFSSTRIMKRRKSDNLYAFEIPVVTFNMEGLVVNEITKNPLPAVTVNMTGSDGSSTTAITGTDGKFKFDLAHETDYIIVTSKAEFYKGNGSETTKGLNKSTTLQLKILMQPIVKNVAFEVENIFYDLDKATLRDESVVALNKLVALLTTNENLQIELGSHSDFRGKDSYNQELSQRRAQSVVDYLIGKGIATQRLVAKGYGESVPRTMSEKLHLQYPNYPEGSILDETYINGLASEELKDQAHQINRRTEFRVLRTDFDVNAINFGKH